MRPASTSRLLPLACLLLASLAAAQDVPGAASGPPNSKIDFAGAYGYIRPFISDINLISYQPILGGGVFSGSYYFKPRLGIQVEGIYSPAAYNDNNCVYTAQAGPILRTRRGRLVPYVHLLGGAAEVGGPSNQTCSVWGWGLTAGGGLDYVLPVLHDHFALRLVQADFNYSHVVNPNPPVHNVTLGGIGDLYDVHLSGGLVLRLTGRHGATGSSSDATLDCSAEPSNPFPGDPVNITSNLLNSPSDKDLRYLWETSAGHIAGNGPSAAVDTLSLAPGTYTVAGHLVRGPHDKPVAACTTSFTIRPLEPPSVTCSADRAAINSGDPVTITAMGTSPLALTYSYTATNGMVTGNGPTAALSTIGSTPGTITVTCSVVDAHGQTAAVHRLRRHRHPHPDRTQARRPKPLRPLLRARPQAARPRRQRSQGLPRRHRPHPHPHLRRQAPPYRQPRSERAKPQRRRARHERRPIPHRREGHRSRPPRSAHRQQSIPLRRHHARTPRRHHRQRRRHQLRSQFRQAHRTGLRQASPLQHTRNSPYPSQTESSRPHPSQRRKLHHHTRQAVAEAIHVNA